MEPFWAERLAAVALFVLLPAAYPAVIFAILAADDAAPGVASTDELDRLIEAKQRRVLNPLRSPEPPRFDPPPSTCPTVPRADVPDVLGRLVAAKRWRPPPRDDEYPDAV